MVEWKETRNCSKSAMKWRNMSEMSLATTIGLESNPFILFTLKQWSIEVFWTHQFIGVVPEPRFGKVGWSSSSKSGSQGGGLVENDYDHYETIDQMNNIEIFIHWTSNPYYNTKNEYKLPLTKPWAIQASKSKNGVKMGDFRGNFGFAAWGGVVLSKYGHGMVQETYNLPRRLLGRSPLCPQTKSTLKPTLH